jgi:endonuclease/exonuclease/phosphatase family metal-dependent hydrolase
MATLRVGTYNILHGMRVLGGAQERDNQALRGCVQDLDVDVLGLQEVDAAQPRSGMVHQTAEIADAMNADHWRFVPTVVGTPGHEANFRPSTPADVAATWDHDIGDPLYGVGLVSRVPVLRWDYLLMKPANVTMPLLVPGNPRPRLLKVPDEPRAAVAAVLDLPTPVTVCTLHLSFVPFTNTRQLRHVKDWLKAFPRPLILLGDFNLPGRIAARVTQWHETEAGATYPVFRPRVQFDHILSHGIAGFGAKVHPLAVSDHCAVTAEFSL